MLATTVGGEVADFSTDSRLGAGGSETGRRGKLGLSGVNKFLTTLIGLVGTTGGGVGAFDGVTVLGLAGVFFTGNPVHKWGEGKRKNELIRPIGFSFLRGELV